MLARIKFLILSLIVSATCGVTSSSFAKPGDWNKCATGGKQAKDWYNKIVEIYEANGYSWPETFSSCLYSENYGFILWKSGRTGGGGSDVYVTLKMDPKRLEFNRGASTPLFCAVLRNNRWTASGKTCD